MKYESTQRYCTVSTAYNCFDSSNIFSIYIMTKEAKDRFMFALGALVMTSFFIILGLLIFVPMPENNKDVLYLIIGALIGFAGSVVNYFYGSSKGSADKNEMIKGKQNE